MQTLSDEIRNSRYGAISNPYQGTDKKVLFVCSMGILRSATAARLYAHKYNTRSVGTYPEALIQINGQLVAWADEIVFVNQDNYKSFIKAVGPEFDHKIKVLDIPDQYPHMDDRLVEAFLEQYEPL